MATRKVTVSLPEEVAARFLRLVPSTKRSEYVADALTRKMRERDEMLIAACEAANCDAETQLIEQEMAALPDTVTEEWNAALPLAR